MISRLVSDEVTDGIAAIELHRQGTEQESGLAVACSEALRKLQALLEQEKEALQLHGPDTVHAINVDALTGEIKRVQSMVGKGKGTASRNTRARGQQRARLEGAHNSNSARKRGRRNLGRGGGRGGRGGRGNAGGGSGGAGPGAR